ncbi:DUF7507 domain-containing protein [Algoriphagus aquimarinus]|uniref:Ig-like domain-containing protein n=1 Tax=Algoriphagus aquimarinus TaxID=237018 RepID=UPI0030D6DE2F|tara:strand:+ start:372836 stop:384847 length:12012 start_codon:yes stop_codon:yes gene_type:complete
MKTFFKHNMLTLSGMCSRFYFGITFLLLFTVSFGAETFGQSKAYPTTATVLSNDQRVDSASGCGIGNLLPCMGSTVKNVNNTLSDNNDFSRMYASPGILGPLGKYSAEIELNFGSNIPADTWSYVRIGADSNLLQALLGGSLGDLLSDVLSAVLFGQQEIEIQARNSVGSTVLSRNSTQGFDTDRVRLVQDGAGNYFLAIKPSASYNRIRLINTSTSIAGFGAEYTLDVYNAFYLNGDDACGEFRFTSFDGEGISVDLLGSGVENAENAIDADQNSYSEISIGTLGVGASMFQSIYYETPSAPEDYFKVKLAIANAAVLTADLIGGIEVRAYNGSNLVYITKLQGGLINGLDLLTLLQNGDAVTLPFGPGVSFDRITVGYNSLVSLSALSNSPIRLYDVQRFGATCIDPDPIPLPAATDPMLSNGTCDANVLAFENANFPFNAVDGNNDTYTTLSASSGIALGIGDYEGFVELGFDSRPAGTSSYVRIDFDEEVLLGLIDGTAGQLLGGVVDNVLFGSHYFTVEVKNNGSQVFASSSNNGFFNRPVKIVQDKNNHYYIEVTPDSPYTSIRITESLGAIAGLGEVRSMNVYHVCSSAGFEACEQAFATYSESNGISLDLLGLGAAGVSNAGFAIDGNPATASEISIGVAGIGASVYQFVDFHTSSAPADHFRVKLAMEGGGVLTAEVLGSIVVKAFEGDTEVFSQELRDGLVSGLDLLGLLQSGGTINLPFGPGLAFDRLAVGIESAVSANAIQNPLKVFSIERFSADCPDPELTDPTETIPPFTTSDCAVEVVDWENTNFPLNAIDGNNDSYAVLSASAGTALGLGSYSSQIELKYGAAVAAGETSYVRIEFENDELNALLGGSLGSDLADLLGTIALGDHYFTVTPITAGGTDIYTASSQTSFGNQDVRVVRDESGRFYIAFTADQAYQSVRIEHFLTALIGAENTATMHVFSMCRETEFDLCEQATFTDFDGSGIAVDLLDITQGGVFNPHYAIDGNSSNYSTINLGLAGVGASVYQNIYFKTKSQTTDALRIRVQLEEAGILNLDLAGSYRVILYNGNEEVYNESLQNALINNLDVLGLLNSGGIQELLVEPGVVYDRVSFGLQSLVAINTSAPIRLYGISRISAECPDPDVIDPPYLSPVCAEELVDAAYADNLPNLFDGNFNSFATINSKGGVIGSLGAFSGHVTLGFGTGVTVPAGTTSYMRIDTDASLLDALLGGSVGAVLSDLLNTVILGNHYFNVIANDASGTPLFTASSANGFGGYNDQVKIVQDALGRYYLAITPNAAYNSITIEDHTDALLLGQDNSINVYGLCYDIGAEACATGFTTSFDGSGITVDAGSIGSYGVTNAERALDNNNNDDYSELSLGTLGVAGSIQQNIQFRQTIAAGGSFKIKLGVGSGVLDAGVFGRIEVVGYLDGVEVYEETLENAVIGSVNLVDLFNNGANEEIRISPGVAVDEIAIRLRSLVSVTAVPNVRLYYVLQDCETPLFQSWKSYIIDGDASLTSVSGGETVQYTIHVRNTGTVPMTDYLITDAIPAHTTYVDGSGGVNVSGVITFENLDIASGATATVSFSVLVDQNLTDVEFISNVALVKSNPGDIGTETYPPLDNENPTDPDESGDTGTDIPVDPIFSAEIWKSVTVDADATQTTVSGGETLVYTIFVRNTGNQDLTDLSINDELPTGVSYVSGGTLTGTDVSYTLASLSVGQSTNVGSFTVKVDSDLTGIDEIRNIAIVSSADLTPGEESFPPVDNTNPTDPNTTADPGTVLDVTPVHSIDFDKIGLSNNADSDGKAIVGDIITYTLTVTNTGNKALTDISVVDQIPANTTVVNNGGGTAGSGTLTFDISSLGVGAMQEFTFTVEVDAVTGSAPIVNNAEAFFTDETGGNASETAQHSMATDCTVIDAGDIILTVDQSAICEGESTILHASLNGISISNPEFRWYLNANLTGAFFTGADYQVSPSANTTYYVTVVAEGYCFSTPAATTAITVNVLPDVPSTSSDVIISEGFGTVLTASIDPMPADVEIVWYNEGGSELATGSSYNTGVLSAGVYTYYAGTRNTVTGCLSIDITGVTVTVEPLTVDTDCTVANAQNNGTYVLCVLCSVENPGNAVDGNINTYSRFVAPVAVTGGVWQELVFGQTGAAGDTIVITVGTAGSVIDLGVISGLSFESYSGSNGNGDGGTVDNNLISLTLLGANSKGEVRFVAGGAYDRVRIEYRPVLGALESGWRIYQAQINYPVPTAITDGLEVCEGETATLEATAAAGTSLRWYDQETAGTLLASGNSYTTPALSPAGIKNYYIAVVRDGCEDPIRIPVTVKVNPGATSSDIIVSDVEIVKGESTTLSATSSTVTNPIFRFYTDSNLTNEITNLTVSPSVTTTYYVTVSGDGICENSAGDAATITVTVIEAPVADDLTLVVTPGTPLIETLPITPGSGAIVDITPDLSAVPAGVTITIDGSGVVTINVPAGYTGPASFEVPYEVTDENGLSDIGTMRISVNGGPVADDVALTVTPGNPLIETLPITPGSSAIVDITPDLSAVPAGVTITIDGSGVVTINVPAGYAGPASFEVPYEVTDENGLSDIGTITITVNGGPVADDVTLTVTPGTPLIETLPITPGSGAIVDITPDLSAVPSGVTLTIDGAGVVTVSVPANYTGALSFEVPYEVTDENGLSDTGTITVKVIPSATEADITADDLEICEGETTTLSATSPTVTNPVFRFYTDAGLTSEVTNLSVSPAATSTYYVTVSGDGINENAPGDAATITVTVNPGAMTSDISTTNVEICAGESTTLSASSTTVANPVFRFYTNAALTSEITNLTVSPTVTTTYYVTVTGDGVCENAPGNAAMLTVTVNKTDAPIVNNPNQNFCETDNPTLNSIAIVGTGIKWYASANDNSPLDLSTPLANGVTYYATQTNPLTNCESIVRARVKAILNNCNTNDGLVIQKIAESEKVFAGATFTYTISVRNTNSSAVSNVTVTDALDSRLTYVSSSNSGQFDAGTVTWNIPSIPANSIADLTVWVSTSSDLSAGTQISNVAIVSSPDDPDSPKESDPEVVTVEKDVDLVITKTASVSSVFAGGDFSYKITVSNTGQSDATSLSITDALPDGLTFISADNGGTNNGGTVTWSVPTLVAGASIDLILNVMVNADVIGGTQISNLALVFSTDDSDSPKESEPAVVTVTKEEEKAVNLTITKTASVTTVLAGGDFSYMISVSNTGNKEATDLSITDALPDGLTFTSADNGGTNNAGTVTWSVPTLSAGATVNLVLNVMVNAEVAGGTEISNVAIVSSPDDPEPPKESDPEVVTVQKNVDLTITKTASTSTVLAGGDFSYTISVSNTGNKEATDLNITDALPDGLTFISADNGGTNNGGTVTWSVPTLAAGATVNLVLNVMVNAEVPGGTEISNVAIVSSPDDPETPKESDPEVVTVQKDVDLTITKKASTSTVLAGGDFSYTISVSNAGNKEATNLSITDALPDGLTFISADNGGINNAGTVTWSVPTLAAGASIDLILNVKVNAEVIKGAKISNIAIVSSPDDPEPPTESDPEVVEVIDPLSFTIEKVSNVSEARIGDDVTYTIKVTNISSLVKEEIDVTDRLPEGLLYLNSDQEGIFNNGVVSWIIPSLAAGQTIELTLVTKVTDEVEVGDIIYNTAVVDLPGDGEDPTESDPGDGVLVIDEPTNTNTFITARKWTDVDKVAVGDLVDFTIRIENSGDYMAYDLMVIDSLPAGTMAMEANPAGEISDKAVVWNVDSLAAGAWFEVKVKLLVMADEGPMVNWAFISGRNIPDVSTSTTPMDPSNEVDLVLDKQVSSSLIQVDSDFEYKITVTNNSENTSNDVVVTDVLPTSVEYLGADVSSGSISYNAETRTLSWTMVSIDPMVVETMTIQVKAISEGSVTNTASAVSDDEELESSDNTDTVTHSQLVFRIPNVFTPNGDGINDTWVVRGLQEFFQRNELMIVNRWGVEVYKSTNYQNDWNGENLIGGTYYYQFQLTDSQGVSHTMTGYVTIIK